MVEQKGSGNPLEDYLAKTIDLRNESALVREGDQWQTLDGTPHVPLQELAQRTSRSLGDLQANFDAGRMPGVQIGDQRFARQGS